MVLERKGAGGAAEWDGACVRIVIWSKGVGYYKRLIDGWWMVDG